MQDNHNYPNFIAISIATILAKLNTCALQAWQQSSKDEEALEVEKSGFSEPPK